MIVLACVLGLRIGDIKLLKFSNFNWEEKKLSIVQHKTKKPLTLPIPDEVGWAVIDYIKNGRPSYYETDIIFLKHMPPFDPIGDDNHMYQIITKYMRKAGINRRTNTRLSRQPFDDEKPDAERGRCRELHQRNALYTAVPREVRHNSDGVSEKAAARRVKNAACRRDIGSGDFGNSRLFRPQAFYELLQKGIWRHSDRISNVSFEKTVLTSQK